MNRGKITIFLGLLLAFAVTASGCTTFDNFKQAFFDKEVNTDEAINIGIYEPLGGADKEAAALEVQGIELANSLYPEAAGKKIRLIYADNNSDIDAAETAISTLLTKNPAVILGSYGALYSLIAGEQITGAKVPAIAMTNTNPLVTRNNSYYFRVCYIDATQGRLLCRYLESLDVEEAGVLLPEDDEAAMAMTTSFVRNFKSATENDDAVPYYEKYTTGETDFDSYLDNIEKSGVKYVVLSGETTDMLNIINQAAKRHLDVTFLGDTRWGEEDFHKGLSKRVDPNHLAFVQFFVSDGKIKSETVSEERQQFLDAWHKKYGNDREPEEAVALGYDAYRIALDAIEKSSKELGGKIDGEAIRDTLLDKDYQYEGASGIIRFNSYGDPQKTAYISTWDRDTIKSLYTIPTDMQ